MKELWRWRPPVALGHPHTTNRDLEYQGMRILKDRDFTSMLRLLFMTPDVTKILTTSGRKDS
jgi:cytochrome P450